MRIFKLFLLLFATNVHTVRTTDTPPAQPVFLLDVAQATEELSLLHTYLQALLIAIDPTSKPEITTEKLIQAIHAANDCSLKKATTPAHSEEELKILQQLVDTLKWCTFIDSYISGKIAVSQQTIALPDFIDQITLLDSVSIELPAAARIEALKDTLKELYKTNLTHHKEIPCHADPKIKEVHASWLHIIRRVLIDLQKLSGHRPTPPPAAASLLRSIPSRSHGEPPVFIQYATARPRQHPVINGIKEQLTNYAKERKTPDSKLTAKHIAKIIEEQIEGISAETFTANLQTEQIMLLATATGYSHCAALLSDARNTISTAMHEDLSYSDVKLNTMTKELIAALITDMVYRHLQDTETTLEYRLNLKAILHIPPTQKWHQDIIKSEELPSTKTIDETDPDDIMKMIERWALTRMISVWKCLNKEKALTAEETLEMDRHLIDNLIDIKSYNFSENQKEAFIKNKNKQTVYGHIVDIEKAIKKKEAGHTTTLLSNLFHQTIIYLLLELIEHPNMPTSMTLKLKNMRCFQMLKAQTRKKKERRK